MVGCIKQSDEHTSPCITYEQRPKEAGLPRLHTFHGRIQQGRGQGQREQSSGEHSADLYLLNSETCAVGNSDGHNAAVL